MTTRLRAGFAGVIVAGGVLCATASFGDWPYWGGDGTHTLAVSQPLPAPMGILWKFAAKTPKTGENRSGVIVQGDTLYFGSGNVLYAVDKATGSVKWQQPEAGSPAEATAAELTSCPAVGGGMVFAPDQEGVLTAYSASDGQLKWERKARGPIRGAPIVVDKTVYYGSDDDNLYAIDIATGNTRWILSLGDDLNSPPAYQNGMVFAVTADMKVWAINAETGAPRWTSRVTAPTLGIAPVVAGPRLMMVSGSQMATFRLGNGDTKPFPLTVLEPVSVDSRNPGGAKKYYESPMPDASCTPIITDAAWYVGDRNGKFYAFNRTGREIWQLELDGRVQAAPVLTGPLQNGRQMLYAATLKGLIFGIDVSKGTVDWTYRMEPAKGIEPRYSYYAYKVPLVVDADKLYALSDDGILACFSPTAPDYDPPTVVLPKPARGSSVNGAPPITFSAYVWDEGSGINPESIEVTLDGKTIDKDQRRYDSKSSEPRKGYVYDPIKRTLTYTFQSDDPTGTSKAAGPEKRLPAGRHEMGIMVTDWLGNATEYKWGFLADPTLPKPAVIARQQKQQRLGGGQPGGLSGGGGIGGGDAGLSGPGGLGSGAMGPGGGGIPGGGRNRGPGGGLGSGAYGPGGGGPGAGGRGPGYGPGGAAGGGFGRRPGGGG